MAANRSALIGGLFVALGCLSAPGLNADDTRWDRSDEFDAFFDEAGISPHRAPARFAAQEVLPQTVMVERQPQGETGGADCHPKYIYSGNKVTIHLIGQNGTVAYWLGHHYHLARLERFFHPVNPPKRDMYFFSRCSDPSTTQWAIGVTPDCEGRFPVWRMSTKGWCFVEFCHRSTVN